MFLFQPLNYTRIRSIPLRRKQSEEEQKRWLSLTEEEKSQYDPPIQPLRLIIMSATMRITDFQNPTLFPIPPPVIRVTFFSSYILCFLMTISG